MTNVIPAISPLNFGQDSYFYRVRFLYVRTLESNPSALASSACESDGPLLSPFLFIVRDDDSDLLPRGRVAWERNSAASSPHLGYMRVLLRAYSSGFIAGDLIPGLFVRGSAQASHA